MDITLNDTLALIDELVAYSYAEGYDANTSATNYHESHDERIRLEERLKLHIRELYVLSEAQE